MKYIKKLECFTESKTYIKTFEFGHDPSMNPLYQNKDFEITQKLSYKNWQMSMSAIFAMSDLIRTKSKYLTVKKLRNIKITDNRREQDIEFLDLYDVRVKNIEKYRTSQINNFLSKPDNENFLMEDDFINNIPNIVYMNLTFQYYPIIEDAIKNSKTLGDIIDKFTIIYKDISCRSFTKPRPISFLKPHKSVVIPI